MAAFPGGETGSRPSSRLYGKGTNPLPDVKRDEEDALPPSGSRTVAQVFRRERGNSEARDQFRSPEGTNSNADDVAAATATRKKVAEKLSAALGRLLASYGTLKASVALELLKRELSRSHDVLRSLPSEADFLSLVVLAEMVLGGKPCKQLTREELTALRSTLAIGTTEPRVTFNHYNRAFRRFNASGGAVGPVFEFEETNEPEGPLDEPPDE